jgi:hypothetical protein
MDHNPNSNFVEGREAQASRGATFVRRADWRGLVRAVRWPGVEPQARIYHDYAVTGVPGVGWTIHQNKEHKTKNKKCSNYLCSLFFSPCSWYWRPRRLGSGSALAALPPCSNRWLSESWRSHWLRRRHLNDYNMCRFVAQSAIRPRHLRTTNIPIAVVLRRDAIFCVETQYFASLRNTQYAVEYVLQIVL